MMSPIYRDIGGDSVLREVVDRFYRKVLADGRLAGYFDGTDIARLKTDQVKVFGAALGGEDVELDRGTRWHRMRGIDHEEFDLVVCYLADALHAARVPHGAISEILFTLAPLARDIVSVPEPRRGEDSSPTPPNPTSGNPTPKSSASQSPTSESPVSKGPASESPASKDPASKGTVDSRNFPEFSRSGMG